jgi:hypothetical protein
MTTAQMFTIAKSRDDAPPSYHTSEKQAYDLAVTLAAMGKRSYLIRRPDQTDRMIWPDTYTKDLEAQRGQA